MKPITDYFYVEAWAKYFLLNCKPVISRAFQKFFVCFYILLLKREMQRNENDKNFDTFLHRQHLIWRKYTCFFKNMWKPTLFHVFFDTSQKLFALWKPPIQMISLTNREVICHLNFLADAWENFSNLTTAVKHFQHY